MKTKYLYFDVLNHNAQVFICLIGVLFLYSSPLSSFQTRSFGVFADGFSAEEMARLRPGDVVLRRGYGRVSDFILKFLAEKKAVTHCGILQKKDGAWHVFHTESNQQYNGTLLEPLADFARQSHPGSLMVVRPKGTTMQTERVLRACEFQLKNPKPFDLGFNYKDSTKLYCAELIRNIYLDVYRAEMFPERKAISKQMEVLKMDNFQNPQFFEVIVD